MHQNSYPDLLSVSVCLMSWPSSITVFFFFNFVCLSLLPGLAGFWEPVPLCWVTLPSPYASEGAQSYLDLMCHAMFKPTHEGLIFLSGDGGGVGGWGGHNLLMTSHIHFDFRDEWLSCARRTQCDSQSWRQGTQSSMTWSMRNWIWCL